jgi:hypothetical protein
MQKDERDLLDVLKFELEFLEKGGYGRSPREPWRPQFIFEDSPTCMNFDCKESPGPCSACVLMQLVPPESRAERIPCRHIALNDAGETLDSLYRYADEREIENAMRSWIRKAIAKLEDQRAHPTVPSETQNAEPLLGIALHQSLHPKCANPSCASAFHWLAGGKFFRFRAIDGVAKPENETVEPPAHDHGVKHYWLCEHCARIFTLMYDQDSGVVLKLLWPELPVAELHKAMPAA